LDNRDGREDHPEADDEYDVQPQYAIENLATSGQWDVCATHNVPGLIQPTWMSKIMGQMVLMTVNAMETMRNKGYKKMQDRMCQYVFTRFYMLLHQKFHLEIYYCRILSSRMLILIDIQNYSGQNETFSKVYKLY